MVEGTAARSNREPMGQKDMRIGTAEHEALDRDGYVLLGGAFTRQRVQSLREGVADLLERARGGACTIPWIDAAAGVPDRIGHMMHPDKYHPAWGQWLADDVAADLEALLQGPARHSLFGMLAGGAGHGYRMAWHRDIGKPGASDEADFLRRHHGRLIQFNAPLLEGDNFLHVVPGSHVRASTAEEIAAARAGVAGTIAAGIEVRLEPGDILYYNANLWHRGWNPDGHPRQTLHAAYWKAEYPVMIHEHGQQEALGAAAHLQRLPPQTRQLIQRYLDAHADAPKSLLDL
ncbi:MAG: phytanoyl-CoA dioxygenase family protein [bacterium]|nr:phytanoyl-CoA dioxygenase family protein [bacterium]